MSNRNYESQILDAIQILVDNTVAKANYDKTIKATISRCVDPTIGKYVIKYQNSSFYAYSYNTENKYTAGSAVYVLVPGNDMSQEKSIIGTVDKLGIDYVSIIEGENGYEVTGLNVIKTHADYGLCSYKTQDVKVLYNRDENINLLEIDAVGLKTYIEQSSSIICGATFKTELSTQQKTRGDYGIGFDLDFIDNATGENVTRTYVLNIDQMTGQPYNYNTPSRQYDIFEVDGRNFVSIKQIYIFSYNFPYNENNKPDDIFVSNIELSAANALDKETVSTAVLSFITPQGIYFDDNNLDTDAKAIEAQIKIKGQNIDNDSQKDNIEYYWFKENDSISSKSQKYNKIGGAGWECLNLCNIIENATEEQEAIVSWVPGDYRLLTTKGNNIAKETKYKCVAVYKKETTLSKIITIYNHSSDYNIIIKSDAGTAFYYDLGTPTLTCFVNDKEELENDYTYVWSSVDSKNRFTTIQETLAINEIYNEKLARYNELQSQIENNMVLVSEVDAELQECKQTLDQYEFVMRVEKNKIHQLKISEITNFTTYKCSVFKSNVLIGTASIIISNSLQNDSEYSLVINNGDQVFKYNEQGISPASPSLENPQVVLPLTFTIYDNQGRVVSEKTLKQREISWYVPVDRTLIDLEGIHDNPDEINGEIGTYYDLTEFSFKPSTRYNATNVNNNIKLEVQYKDKKLTAQTNFVFIKTGEVGTNGTNFVCKLIPNTDAEVVPTHPTVIYNEYLKTYKLNYNALNNKWFKVQLWNDGEKIFEGTQTGVSTEDKEIKVSWSILANNYGNNLKDYSNFSIDKNTGVVTFDSTEYEHPANIIKCTILYNKVEYYAVAPVIVSRVKNADYEILLTEGFGFTSAMYTPDGKNPAYNMVSPHDITVNQMINGAKENISLYEPENYKVDYAWNIKGNVYYAEEKLSENLLENKAYKNKEKVNRRFYKPSDTYNGLCVNNAIVCTVTQKGEKIGSIHMPVHLYLNRYGNSAMNGWDGNSIDIGANDGKLILAPQVGAGTKDEQTNTFTGVFMGSIKEAGKTEEEHGLFGYHHGERTITLNAAEGSAKFGKEGLGQIVIDPTTNEAVIRSGVYDPDSGKGMQINLSEPSIKWGNGNFEVDKDGQIWASQYATKNMKFSSSSVDGLDDNLNNLNSNVDDLTASINYLDVLLPTSNVTVETNTDRFPTHSATKTLECVTVYKGTTVRPTVKIEGSHPGITKVNSSYDTERGVTILSFYVDTAVAITDATNNYNITFSYNQEGCSPVTKIISVLVIEKGKDGTSVSIKGTEKNITTLCQNHSSNNTIGDGYILEDDGQGNSGYLFIFTNEGLGNGSLPEDWKNVGKIQGNDGIDGRGVQSITYQYITANSAVKPDISDSRWDDSMEVPTNDKRYLWQKETITFIESDGQQTEQNTILLLAVYGETGKGIKLTEVGYQIWTDGTTIPTGTWLPDPPATSAGDYLWTRIRITYTEGDPVDSYSITYIGKDGKIGADGRGIKSTEIEYVGSTSGTTKPNNTANWSTTIPTVAQGNYLWTRTTITYTDNETTESYSVSRIGTDGTNGKGIVSTTIDYQSSSSGTETPTGEWLTAIPTVSAGNYLWTRTTIEYTEGEDSVSYSVGKMGTNGSTGKGIKSTAITYKVSTNGTTTPSADGWSTTVPSVPSGQFLWTKTTITYSDDTKTEAYSVSYAGTNGNPGSSVTIKSKAIEYVASSSGTTTPSSGWSPTIPSVTKGQYLWTRTTVTYNVGDPVVSYSVGYQGTNGNPGASVTVTSSTTTYQTSDSPTITPTGTWNPNVVATDTTKKYLWTQVVVKFSDGAEAVSYSVSSTMDSITVGGRNLIHNSEFAIKTSYSPTIPNKWQNWGSPTTRELIINNNITYMHIVTTATPYQGYSQSFRERGKDTDGLLGIDYLTFSFMGYAANATKENIACVGIHWLNEAGDTIVSQSWHSWEMTTTPTKYSWTTKVPDNIYSFNIMIGDSLYELNNIYMGQPQLEMGNVATDWSPAPEDLEEDISEAKNTADAAQGEAKTAQQTADSAIDQIGVANKLIEGLDKSQTDLSKKVNDNQSNSIKEVYLRYYRVPYSWTSVAVNSEYKQDLIYYQKTGSTYTKIRPEVLNGKVQTTNLYTKGNYTPPTGEETTGWERSKFAWEDGYVIYQQTVTEYYNNKSVKSSPFKMEDYQTIDDLRYLDSVKVLSTMRGENNYIFYNEDGLFVYNQPTKSQATNAIVINKEGICFQKRASTSAEWSTPTSVWTIDGRFNAKDILVENLNAESIVDGVLTLGNGSKDGELLIQDDEGRTLMECSSQRAIWSLSRDQYVIIGKDCGFQLVDKNGNQIYGNTLKWSTKITSGTYQNNTNYYTSTNLMTMIREATKVNGVLDTIVGDTIPTSGVYTVSFEDTFVTKEQKITGSTNYGDYIQTVNINTKDENNILHKGLAFVAVPTE